MTLTNKELRTLDRHAAAMEAFVKAAKSNAGKELRAERLALEKAVGGKRELDHAGKILVEAEQTHTKMIADAERKAFELVADAEADVARIYEAMSAKEQDLADRQVSADLRQKELIDKVQVLEDAKLAVAAREAVAESAMRGLDHREAQISVREAEVTEREREVEDRTRRFKEAAA